MEPLIDHSTLKAYERLYQPDVISNAVWTNENESVLIRRPYLWTNNGVDIPDAESVLELEQVCEQHGWKIVERYGEHMAIVSVT